MKKTTKPAIWEYLKGGLIKHIPTGVYYCRFQTNGKRTMRSLDTDDAERARYELHKKMAEVSQTRIRGDRVEKGRANVGDIIKEALAAHGGAGHTEKTKKAFALTLRRLETHWPACFGYSILTAQPAKLKYSQAARFASYLTKEAKWRRHKSHSYRKGYGPVTVNVTLEALHRVLTFAADEDYILEVPFDLKKTLRGKGLLLPEPKKEIAFPTQEKIHEVFSLIRTIGTVSDNQRELLSYLQSRADESGDFAEFMAYSGARRQEAASWTWEDEREKIVFIRGTKTESSKDREVPKIAAMVDLLLRMKTRRLAEGRGCAGRAFRISQCREALETACKRAGVPRWTHHSLRHLFATRCIEANVDIATVSRWLGHGDGGALALRTYGHLRQEHSQAQAAKVVFAKAEVRRA